ncbi:CG34231 [Drosophila busckii]|uniref:CG34231 n=1 Tax=Drosophila busckii TaxID=30019 RepID=A0A0M3QUI5_DROBS|nr:CG34231 [Drosophila busckii]
MESTPEEHHKRLEYCTTRPEYRQGRELKAVKVYTVASESRHLLIFGVPKVNLQSNIKSKLQAFVELEAFTDVFAVQFERLEQARFAKRKLDASQFYGGILHISYAPERETHAELREKFLIRRNEIDFRLRCNRKEQTPPAIKKTKALNN